MNHSVNLTLQPRAYGNFLHEVWDRGAKASPRGILTWELIGASFQLKNPLDRVVTARSRHLNVAFGLAEWFSFMLGIDDIGYFQRFIADYDRFSSDGQKLDGCYGTRVNFKTGLGDQSKLHSQVAEVQRVLTADPDSRQAVISIYDRHDLLGFGGKNTPCTLDLQFLVRDGRLNLITYMRSSDAYKGVSYDVMVFTLLQEYVARRLGLELGVYLHRAGSLHLYDADTQHVDAILSDPRWPLVMKPMPLLSLNDLERAYSLFQLGLTQETERAAALLNQHWSSPEARDYLTSLASVMLAFVLRRHAKLASAEAFENVNDRTLRYVIRPWLVTAGVLPDSYQPSEK